MIHVFFKNQDHVAQLSGFEGSPLTDVCLSAVSSPLSFNCRKGRCGTCLIRVSEEASVSSPTEREKEFFRRHRIEDKKIRLGCQVRVLKDAAIESVGKEVSGKSSVFCDEKESQVKGPFPDIGFSTNVLDNPPDVAHSVRFLSEHFNSIELELGERAEDAVYSASSARYDQIIESIRRTCEEKKINLSIHAPYLDHNLASQDQEVRRPAEERLLRSIRVARDLGVTRVTFHPGYHEGRGAGATLAPLLHSLERILSHPLSQGMVLCIENMGNERPDYIVYSAQQQIEICKRSGVRVALDIVHLASVARSNDEYEDELSCLIPFVSNVHMADMNVPKHIHIPLGEGNLPIRSTLSQLWKGGYRGPAIVEEFGGPYSAQMFIDRAIAFRQRV